MVAGAELPEIELRLTQALGAAGAALMHRRSRYLADLTPHELAQDPHGARIVWAELHNIIRQAKQTGRKSAD